MKSQSKFDITSPYGFYSTYFQLLFFYKSRKQAFEYLNDEVGKITGHKPYKTFESWRVETGVQ